MSNPRPPTLTFPVSSPKWRACCAREAISCTPIFAPDSNIAEWEAALAGAPMRMLSHEDINAQVVRGMEKNTPRILDLIGRMPTILRRIGREYAGVEGTAFYRAMQSGKYSVPDVLLYQD